MPNLWRRPTFPLGRGVPRPHFDIREKVPSSCRNAAGGFGAEGLSSHWGYRQGGPNDR
jgi:hypothetical protein